MTSLELQEEIVKQGGSLELGDFKMSLNGSMYVVYDNVNKRRILQMNTYHHDFEYACKCVNILNKRRGNGKDIPVDRMGIMKPIKKTKIIAYRLRGSVGLVHPECAHYNEKSISNAIISNQPELKYYRCKRCGGEFCED